MPKVLVTFDDGHRANLDHALPILEAAGVRAMFFVITGLTQASPSVAADTMSWSELAELESAGHVVGAHSVTHRHLPELTTAEQQVEVKESLAAVAEHLGGSIRHFAYPYGEIPRNGIDLPTGSFGFGTVKSSPLAWNTRPNAVRRTYLPVNHVPLWSKLCQSWRRQWLPQ